MPAGLPLVDNNTFTIKPQATLSFRPVADDPNSAGGQESEGARRVPNMPAPTLTTGANPHWIGYYGSLVVTWLGTPTDIQGIYEQAGYHRTPTNADNPTGPTSPAVSFWGTLLPPGA